MLQPSKDTLIVETLRLLKDGCIGTDEAMEMLEAIKNGDKHPAAIDAKPGKVYLYIRVSTEEQKNHGYSLEAQEQQGRKYFEFMRSRPGFEGLEWGGVFNDGGVSGWKHRLILRPNGRKLNAILRPGDMVLFVKLDRGFRDTKDCLSTHDSWRRRGVGCVFIDSGIDTSTAAGRMFLTVAAAFAEFESGMRSERQRAVNAIRKANHQPCNQQNPLGTKVITLRDGRKKAVPDRRKWAVAHLIVQMREGIGLCAGQKPMTWPAIRNYIVEAAAKHEGREPVHPIFGNDYWGHLMTIQRWYKLVKTTVRRRPVL